MWGRKRRVKNAAVIDVPAGPQKPQNVTITEPANPWPVIIIILIFALPFLLAVAWYSAVFVLNNAGFRNPAKSLADTLIVLAVISLVLVVLQWFARIFFNNYLEHVERMKQYDLDALEIRLETARHLQLTAQAQPAAQTGRMTEENTRWCWIITAVMFTAYERYATDGEFAGNWRPWSRRSVQAIKLRDGTTPAETEASRVQGWLTEQGIIRKNQINIDRYPDLAAVQALLSRLYDVPVQITAGSSALLRSNEGYKHI